MPTVIFDLGGVVLDWQPRRAYAGVLGEDELDDFLALIDFPTWNASHDAGRAYAESEATLLAAHPGHERAILAYRQNFAATLAGMVPGTGAVIAELAAAGVRLVALTNWSAETFPHAQERFGILRRFDDILVSGAEGLAKPDPAIFRLARRRFGLVGESDDEAADGVAIFVDDVAANVAAAKTVGLVGHQFVDATGLRAFLVDRGLLGPRQVPAEPVFHLADRTAWSATTAGAAYPWSGRGLTYDGEGFVHCSFTHQLPAVLDRHYADVDWSDLVLLEIDPSAAPVVVEDLGAGPYPHLYAELTPALVSGEHHGHTG